MRHRNAGMIQVIWSTVSFAGREYVTSQALEPTAIAGSPGRALARATTYRTSVTKGHVNASWFPTRRTSVWSAYLELSVPRAIDDPIDPVRLKAAQVAALCLAEGFDAKSS